jgi:hypothetical protein
MGHKNRGCTVSKIIGFGYQEDQRFFSQAYHCINDGSRVQCVAFRPEDIYVTVRTSLERV